MLDLIGAGDFIEVGHHDEVGVESVGEAALKSTALESFALPIFGEALLGREVLNNNMADFGPELAETIFVFEVEERFGLSTVGEGRFSDDERIDKRGQGVEADFEQVQFVEEGEAIEEARLGHEP